jgi:hypothetical protein
VPGEGRPDAGPDQHPRDHRHLEVNQPPAYLCGASFCYLIGLFAVGGASAFYAQYVLGNIGLVGLTTLVNTGVEPEQIARGEEHADPADDGEQTAQIGYRWFQSQGIRSLCGFGYGLSFTTFSTSDVAVDAPGGAAAPVTVTGSVTNTGPVAGAEVVQVYLGLPAEGQPPKRLVGFQQVFVEPGQSKPVTVTIDRDATNRPFSVTTAPEPSGSSPGSAPSTSTTRPTTRRTPRTSPSAEARAPRFDQASQGSAATTRAWVPVSRVGWTTGANAAEWLTGMSWATRPSAAARW